MPNSSVFIFLMLRALYIYLTAAFDYGKRANLLVGTSKYLTTMMVQLNVQYCKFNILLLIGSENLLCGNLKSTQPLGRYLFPCLYKTSFFSGLYMVKLGKLFRMPCDLWRRNPNQNKNQTWCGRSWWNLQGFKPSRTAMRYWSLPM